VGSGGGGLGGSGGGGSDDTVTLGAIKQLLSTVKNDPNYAGFNAYQIAVMAFNLVQGARGGNTLAPQYQFLASLSGLQLGNMDHFLLTYDAALGSSVPFNPLTAALIAQVDDWYELAKAISQGVFKRPFLPVDNCPQSPPNWGWALTGALQGVWDRFFGAAPFYKDAGTSWFVVNAAPHVAIGLDPEGASGYSYQIAFGTAFESILVPQQPATSGVLNATLKFGDSTVPLIPGETYTFNPPVGSFTLDGLQPGSTQFVAYVSFAGPGLEIVAQTALTPDDTVAPTTTASVTPEPNTSGWNSSDLAVGLLAVDDTGGSGVKNISYALTDAQSGSADVVGDSASINISAEGATTLTFSATDNAGNFEATNSLTVRLDKTGPTITGTVTPAPNASGWHNTRVTVAFKCSDALSGMAVGGLPAPTVLSTDGAGQAVTGTCTDVAGNSASVTVQSINIDQTPPTNSCSSAPDTWSATDVIITCTAQDNGSGLQNPSDGSFTLSTSVLDGTETAAAHTGSRTVCDAAGNCVAAGPFDAGVDKRRPSVTIAAPIGAQYLLNQVVSANYSCSDGGSGVASCVGAVASGAAINTGVVGNQTFLVSAKDVVGNHTSASTVYSVAFAFTALFDQTHAVKAGATMPVKVRLVDAAGRNVSSAGTVVQATQLVYPSTNAAGVVKHPGNANPDANFRYDASLGGYIFNLETTGLSSGTWELRFQATGDSTTHAVQFSVK
jgi:hypothetical protein